MIKEKDSGTNLLRRYELHKINSDLDAIDWISNIRNINGIRTSYILYWDLMNRAEEGSGDIWLDAKVSTDIMEKELQQRDVDAIELSGKFEGKPVVIGVNLKNKLVSICVRKKNQANLDKLEKLLELS